MQIGNAHRELERLLVVEARIDRGLYARSRSSFGEAARAADALGDVLAGELDVHAAEPRAELGVQLEALLELADDLVEPARLDPLRRRLGVAVHRIADPQHACGPSRARPRRAAAACPRPCRRPCDGSA